MGLATMLVLVLLVWSCGPQIKWANEIQYGQLSNGFTYYYTPGDKGKVRISLISKVGAVAGSAHHNGYAHFLEHMMFKGTENLSGKQLAAELDALGLRRGKEITAYTGGTSTEYNIIVPASNMEYLTRALKICKEWAFHLQIDSAAVSTERGVVIEETVTQSNTEFSAFVGTELQGHTIQGSISAINQINADSLLAFYKKYYRPDMLALLIQGDVNTKEVTPIIEQLFGRANRPESPKEPLYLSMLEDEDYIDSTANFRSFRNDATLKITYKIPPIVEDSYENYRTVFAYNILSRMMGNRFMNDSILSEGSVRYSTPVQTTGFVNVIAKANEEVGYNTMLKQVVYVLACAEKLGFSNDEIQYACEQYLHLIQRAQFKAEDEKNAVKKHFANGDIPLKPEEHIRLAKHIKASLTSKEIQSLISEFIKGSIVVSYNGQSKAYSDTFTPSFILEHLQQIATCSNPQFYSFTPPKRMNTQSKIDASFDFVYHLGGSPSKRMDKRYINNDLVELTYENGLKVVLNHTDDEDIEMISLFNGGIQQLPIADRLLFENMSSYLSKGFILDNNISSEEVQKNLGISHREYFEPHSSMSKIKAKSGHLEDLCKYYHATLTQAKASDETQFLKSYWRLKKKMDVPELSGDKKLTENVDYVAVSLNDSLEIKQKAALLDEYRLQLQSGFQNGIVYLSGDLPANASELIDKYIASIPVSKQSEMAKSNHPPYPSGEEFLVNTWQRKSNIIGYTFVRKQTANAPDIKQEMMLEAASEWFILKMIEELREKHGLIYTYGTSVYLKTVPYPLLALNVRFITDAENIKQCKEVMTQVFKTSHEGKMSALQVQNLKAMLKSRYITAFYDENQMTEVWLPLYLKHGKLFSINDFYQIIDAISLSDFQQFMAELIDVENHYLAMKAESKVYNNINKY